MVDLCNPNWDKNSLLEQWEGTDCLAQIGGWASRKLSYLVGNILDPDSEYMLF